MNERLKEEEWEVFKREKNTAILFSEEPIIYFQKVMCGQKCQIFPRDHVGWELRKDIWTYSLCKLAKIKTSSWRLSRNQ